jgi:hypothetical protein
MTAILAPAVSVWPAHDDIAALDRKHDICLRAAKTALLICIVPGCADV